MKKFILSATLLPIFLLVLVQCHAPKEQKISDDNASALVPDTMIARRYFSGFADAHDTYNAISPASDGKIYYVLSSTRHDVGGQFTATIRNRTRLSLLPIFPTLWEKRQKNSLPRGKVTLSFTSMTINFILLLILVITR